jgi:GH18 family chitinase
MKRYCLSTFFALITLTSVSSGATPWITGFWSAGNSRESISNIPWSNITHLNYFAAGISSSGTVVAAYTSQPELSNLVSAAHAHGVKILICISDGTGNAFEPAANSSNVATTASNIASYVASNNFDGVDLDWESGLNTSDYESLISHTRSALPAGKLIMVDMYHDPSFAATAVNQYNNLDQINTMCYDQDNIYVNGGPKPWYNDAIMNGSIGQTYGGTCQWVASEFVSAGVPASKIGIGIPFYGRRWTGATAPNQGSGSISATIYYGDLAQDATRWQASYQKYDTTYKSNYLSIPSMNEFDSYNGVQSVQDISAWRTSQGYGGHMVFTLEYEYVSTASGSARYPLSTALASAVFGSQSVPTISSFTANPTSIISGSASTLSWAVTGATSLSISGGIGTVTGTSTSVSPTTTTTYTLTATNSAGSSQANVTVTVTAPQPQPPPTISSFTSSPATINTGSSSTLSWNASGATSLSINQGVGTVTGTSTSVSPTVTTTYTLTATNSGGSAQASTTISVSSGLAAYWALDDGTGSNAADSSGNGYTMALIGSPTWQTSNSCEINGCLAFNGTTQAGSASAINLSGTSVVTVAFWMKWNAFANDDHVAMEFSSNFNNVTTGFLILPDDSQSGLFQAGLKGNAGYNQVTFARPSAGVWHHYAFIMNKANPAATEVIPYVDGQPVSYAKPTSAENTNAFASDTAFIMARNKSSAWGNGSLDDVRIYSRVLSASEIAALATPPQHGASITNPSSSLATGTVGQSYSGTVTTSGTAPISVSLSSGSLPAGLAINSSGAISGTPTAAGTSAFTVEASNAIGNDAKQFTLTMNPAASATVYNLSDLNWTSATTGLGTVHKNASVLGNVLTLNGKTYTEGIGTNANSTIVYNLGGECSTFTVSGGIDDEITSGGIITLQVIADGTTLYTSPKLTPTSGTRNISVSVAGKQQLTLSATDGTSGKAIASDNADWANPKLTCNAAPPAAN